MKNRILVCCVLFIALTASLSAKSKKNYIEVPGNNEVTVVGKLTFSTDMDRKFLMDTFNVPEDKRDYKDIYVLPYIPGPTSLFSNVHKAKEIKEFESQAWGLNGEYFFVKYSLQKDRTLYFSSIQLFINGSYKLPVELPLNVKVRVPEKEKFIYLGDFNFSAKGFSFNISSSVKDNIEAAQVALNKVTKKQWTLCRAHLDRITEEDLKSERLTYSYESIGTKFTNWYKIYDYVPYVEDDSDEDSE